MDWLCWLSQWWVSWNFYIFDYVENKLYMMSLLAVPSARMRVSILPLSLPEINEKQCLVSVYYCICKLHFIAANTSNTPHPANNKKVNLSYTLGTRKLWNSCNKTRLSLFPEKCQEPVLAELQKLTAVLCTLSPLFYLPTITCYCRIAELLNGWGETAVW